MKWFEIIKIRTEGSPKVQDKVLELARSLLEFTDGPDVNIFSHATVANDLMIVLTWQSEQMDHWGSDLAQGIVGELRRHGLVDHSLWKQID